jgi:hypothetical protein
VPPALNTNADAVDDTDAATRHARNTHLITLPCAIQPAAGLRQKTCVRPARPKTR